MEKRKEPWYIHAGLIVVILIMLYFLVQVAIVEPKREVANLKYWTEESHARMDNIRQAEILWQKKNEKFTDNLEELINFLKTDTTVWALVDSVDTLTKRSLNPFVKLAKFDPFVSPSGDTIYPFQPDSLLISPKTHTKYILQVDTSKTYDTILTRYGKIRRIDSNIVIGTRYFLKCPDGFGTIGDLYSDALKNAASWE